MNIIAMVIVALALAALLVLAHEAGRMAGIKRGWERRSRDWRQFSEGEK